MCFWKTPKITVPKATVAARSIIPYTEAPAPNSPVYGGTDAWKQKKRGSQALQIKRGSDNSNNRVSVDDTGGWVI